MKKIFYAAIGALSLITVACGHPDTYRVEGEIAEKPTMNLRVVSYGDEGTTQAVTAAREGKFGFESKAADARMVEIYDNDYRLLARFMATNGDDISLEVPRSNPYQVRAKGNELSARWSKFLNDNEAALTENANKVVAAYVGEHREDALSTLLLLTEYDASGEAGSAAADSLAALIAPEARLGSISAGLMAQLEHLNSAASREPVKAIPYFTTDRKTATLRPGGAKLNLLAITADGTGHKEVADELRKIARHTAPGKLKLYDLSTAQDTLVWRRSIRPDSATWTQGWVGGGISSSALGRLAVPEVPYFIVTDSAGRQIWRGASAEEARSFIVSKL